MANFRQELLDTHAKVLEQSVNQKKQQELNNALQEKLDQEIAQKELLLLQTLGLANTLGKIIPIIVGLLLALFFFFIQDILPAVSGYWKHIAKVLLALITIFSFVVAFWENPEIFFGGLRRRFVGKCYWLIVSMRGLKSFASTREIDLKNLSIKMSDGAAVEITKS